MTDAQEDAVEELTAFGLSTYAARTFVALVRLGTGTARDVSGVAEVPRPRVYDAVEELRAEGLADVLEATPKRFAPVSAETTSRAFRREYRNRSEQLQSALDELEPADTPGEQRGVWTVDGRRAVTDRVIEFFDAADEEIVYMTIEELLTDELLAALERADERGVSIKLGGVSPDVQERIRAAVPEAELFESLWVWSDTPTGRLLLVDRERTLIGVVRSANGERSETEARRGNESAETAIWGAGDTNGLVVVLRAVFAWRLERGDEL